MWLLWGADLRLQPSWQMSTAQIPRPTWLATESLLTIWWRMPLWGRDCPLPSISGCHPPASLPPAKEVPVPSWLALLWCSLSPLFCEKARLCFQFSQFSHSVMSDSLQPHGIQHTRPPCPSPNTGVYSNSYPLSESVMPSQTSHPLSSPSSLAFSLSQHQSASECHSVLSDSLQPHGLYPWNSPGQNTGVGSLSLLQGIFPTQGSNPGLQHCTWILYQLSHKGSPKILEWVAYPFSGGSSKPRNQTRVSFIAGGFFTK